jgi:integrase
MLAQVKRRPKRRADKRRLTELTVKRAKPRAAAYLIWDSKQSHLALQVQPTGVRVWKCIYSRHGRSRWLTLGGADAIGLSDARTMTAEAMLKVHKGGDPAADRKAERGSGSFAELHQRYVTEHAKQQNKSWRQADALIKKNVLPRLGKLSAPNITRYDVKKLLAKIAETAPIMANQVLASTSAVFSWATKEGIVTSNPCRLITRYPTKDRERILSDSELQKFWSALDGIDPVRATALKVILLTGQRPGEIAHMRTEHAVDHWWRMLGEATANGWPGTKNKASHVVWLSKPVQALLAERLDEGKAGYVFAGARSGPITGLDAAMRSICEKLGIEDKVTPHDLRRTFGSLVTRLGFGRPAMDRLLNHADRSISSVYDRHSYRTEDQHIWESVAAKIMALVEGREGAVVPFPGKIA